MSIDVHSHFNTAVPQLFLDVRKGLSVLNEQRGKCMAQLVEAYTPQPIPTGPRFSSQFQSRILGGSVLFTMGRQ